MTDTSSQHPVSSYVPKSSFVVVISNLAKEPVGMGVLIDADTVVSAAHVVNSALGRDPLATEEPRDGTTIGISLPFSSNDYRRARVQIWVPPKQGAQGSDICTLRLTASAPNDALAAEFIRATSGTQFRACRRTGPTSPLEWGYGKVSDQSDGGYHQVEPIPTKPFIKKGFSGGPAICQKTNCVLGIVSRLNNENTKSKVGHIISSSTLAQYSRSIKRQLEGESIDTSTEQERLDKTGAILHQINRCNLVKEIYLSSYFRIGKRWMLSAAVAAIAIMGYFGNMFIIEAKISNQLNECRFVSVAKKNANILTRYYFWYSGSYRALGHALWCQRHFISAAQQFEKQLSWSWNPESAKKNLAIALTMTNDSGSLLRAKKLNHDVLNSITNKGEEPDAMFFINASGTFILADEYGKALSWSGKVVSDPIFGSRARVVNLAAKYAITRDCKVVRRMVGAAQGNRNLHQLVTQGRLPAGHLGLRLALVELVLSKVNYRKCAVG